MSFSCSTEMFASGGGVESMICASPMVGRFFLTSLMFR